MFKAIYMYIKTEIILFVISQISIIISIYPKYKIFLTICQVLLYFNKEQENSIYLSLKMTQYLIG